MIIKRIAAVLSSITLVFLLASCNDESLQSYLVESQEKSGFITFDLPASILQLRSDSVSEETKKALNSLKKISIVALPFNDNAKELEIERNQIEAILKKSKYISLMRMREKEVKINLYYTGSEDAIDEVIVFGYSEKRGVGIARIIGENINPSEIIKMMKYVKFDSDNINLEKFTAIFSDNSD